MDGYDREVSECSQSVPRLPVLTFATRISSPWPSGRIAKGGGAVSVLTVCVCVLLLLLLLLLLVTQQHSG